jgi:hypothetical protein
MEQKHMKKRATSAAHYEVGYCKPPKHTRFKKGQSGNPGGRRKRPCTMAETLHNELSQTTVVDVGGKKKTVTKMEAAVKRLIEKSISGDMSAFRVLSVLSHVLHSEETGPNSEEMEAADWEIVQGLVRQLASAPQESSDLNLP